MKIAFATDDGKTISSHFGQASHYMVVTVENGKTTKHEMRDKLSHQHFANEPHTHDANQPHGMDPASQDHHVQMADAIRDCEAMLCRGMGNGVYTSMRSLNIRPILTDITDIEEAVKAYVDGSITDHAERLH